MTSSELSVDTGVFFILSVVALAVENAIPDITKTKLEIVKESFKLVDSSQQPTPLVLAISLVIYLILH